MCKITDIRIEGFRGIKKLVFSGTKSVNVLLGNNNSSKSSALEAIMILMGASRPVLPVELNANRNYNGLQKDDIRLFFYELNAEKKISIDATFKDSGKRNLQISYFESEINRMPISEVGNSDYSMQNNCYGLFYEYTDGEEKNISKLLIRTNKNELSSHTSEKTPIRKSTAFVAPRYNFNEFIKYFNQIVTDKKKDSVLEVLRNVEPRIKDIVVVGEKVMVDVGYDKLLPINVLGDGTRKMFTLVTAMYRVQGGILIVDEVDNGLYYKTMETLWLALLKSARQLDVQLFISTHSIDSLNALNKVLTQQCAESRQDVCIFTLRRSEDGEIKNYRYDYEKFSYVLAREVEIR
ncbi:ATP-binding protein [uncultured Bacteroides sp.]|uniref:AAA family ATPase n=1 Tax=uncultured Bacteroides sp. TaxID=162156 RepID=UPI0025E992AB|nr:ATP-binding protein [uncultured Bacteroides sp.]